MGRTLPQGTDSRAFCHPWAVHTAVYWFGFLGAWLLFAGPIFQASVELRAEDEATERMERATDALPPPRPVSNWWWLLPPVRMILSSRRSQEYRETVLAALSPEDLDVIVRYINIARGWMLVGAGAFLIALKETWELVEHQEWPTWLYWVLIVFMAVLALGVIGGSAERERRARVKAVDAS
jgi:hypothetical protein